VLLSWALPRGLPNDPDVNRLAVRTEDHPIEYLDFEGDIPRGNYGAGSMRIVDRGTYEFEKEEERKLVLTLSGERLGGRFSLFATRGKDWMIHRMDGAPPGWEPIPAAVPPMGRTVVKPGAIDAGLYAFTIAWGGLRVMAVCDSGKLELREAETGGDVSGLFPEVRGMLRDLGIRDALLEGELTVLDPGGRPDPERLASRLARESDSAIRSAAKRAPATLILGDLLHLDGRPLLGLAFEDRLEEMRKLVLDGDAWRTAGFHIGDAEALLAAAAAQGLDGILGKRLDSVYDAGAAESADAPPWVLMRTQDG
jgi:bifunctional non-homologous end joining protein LigD